MRSISPRAFWLVAATSLVTAPRMRAGYPDLSKGHPPAVLDARVGVNTRLGEDSLVLPANQRGQAEPHIIRSVTNPDLLLAAFQEGRFFDAGSLDCGYAVSRDGGLTWTRALVPNLTSASGGRFNRATDPVVGAGPQGDLYVQTLGSVQGAFALSAVVVSRSTDGGMSWSSPITVFETTITEVAPDKNWLAVNDYAGSPNAGRLVSTWTNFISNAAGVTIATPVVASISDDRGLTWSTQVEVTPPGSNNQGTQPVFLPDGTLAVIYVAFLDPSNASRFSIQCKRSIDGGRTFPALATTVVASVLGWDDPDLRDGVFLPSATVSRQSGELFVTYAAVENGAPRIFVTKSSNQGATWSRPAVASDQPGGVSVMNPAIAVTPDGSAVSVVFMDKRNAPDGRNFVDHYAAQSFDGGITWQPNLRLTEFSSDIRYGPMTSRGVMLGDYLGVAPSWAADQPCVAIWCDTRSGDSDPHTVRFAPMPTPDFEAWRVARFSRAELKDPTISGTNPGALARLSGPNLAYYDDGTNPRTPGAGESLVLTRRSSDVLDVAWVSRTGSAVVSDISFSSGGNFPAPVPMPESGIAPNIPLPLGLRWHTERIVRAPPGMESIRRSVFLPPPVRGQPTLMGSANDFAANATDSRLVNLSTRGRAGTGASQLIVGFVIDGGAKSVLVRAIGPTLAQFGNAGGLADPKLELVFGSLGQLTVFSASNDDWQTAAEVTPALFARLGAFALPATSKDAALVITLPARSYTAVVSGGNNTTGIALVEAYDADPTPGAPTNPRLLNLSTRGDVGTGENALIAGFVITGTQARRVLIRAVGPALARFGVSGTLGDPLLTLFQGNTQIAANDDWEISRSSAAIAATADRVGAFPLGAASLDAALLITLAPGAYTATISGVDGATGLALVEIYDAD